MKRRWLDLILVCAVSLLPTIVWGGSLPTVDPEKLDELDSIESLAAQLGEDRLVKYLIRSCDPNAPAEKISRSLLDEIIAKSLADGTALKEMGKSLGMGDDFLRKAMTDLLKSLSFDDLAIKQILKMWAAGKPPDSLANILLAASQQEKTFTPLVEYLLNTTNGWPRVCNNVFRVLDNDELLSPEMLRASITIQDLIPSASVDPTMAAARAGDFESRLRLMQAVSQLLNRSGTVASYLAAAGEEPTSWYKATWTRCLERIAGNPVLLYNYVRRLRDSSFLYDEWRKTAIKALDKDDMRFFVYYYRASDIPGSRFAIAYRQVLPEEREIEIVGTETSKGLELKKGMIERMKESSKWTDTVLWHLTRPAEAFVMTMRSCLPQVLENSQELCQHIIDAISGLNQDEFAKLLAKTPAFSFYGDIEAFRIKSAAKELTPEAYKTFGLNCGKLLSFNDTAWNSFFRMDPGERGNASIMARRGVLSEAIKADTPTAAALIRTVQTNDERLSTAFGKWLVETQRSTSMSTYKKWVDELVRQLNTGEVMGNPDVANFRAWMIDFMKTDIGWKVMEERVNIESATVNAALRESLVAWLVKDEPQLWKLLRATAATEGLTNVTLIPRLRNFVINSKLNEYLLKEITAQNQVAIQSVYLVWPRLLGSTAQTTTMIIDSILKGEVLNDVYPVFATALSAVFEDDSFGVPFHKQMAMALNLPESTPHETVVENARQQITTRGDRSNALISTAMADGTIREAWRKQFLNEVRIMGRAHVVTSYILHRQVLQKTWAKELSDALTEDPSLLEKIINALGSRKLGDRAWIRELNEARQEVARTLVEDRVMFEQILANKTTLFSDAFRARVIDIFSREKAREWMPEISNN